MWLTFQAYVVPNFTKVPHIPRPQWDQRSRHTWSPLWPMFLAYLVPPIKNETVSSVPPDLFQNCFNRPPTIFHKWPHFRYNNFRYQKWRVALWQNLENCPSIICMVHVIHFHSVSCFVFQFRLITTNIEIAYRKWQNISNDSLPNHFSSWDGETFKNEPLTAFTHYLAMALGSYRDSPFVTGSFATGPGLDSPVDGVETEILDYASGTWVQADDYPFSETGRYV